jgi:hypothetical protein
MNKHVGVYDSGFYQDVVPGSLRSARAIIPILLGHVTIQTAVDVGCGCGAWLHVLHECGVTEIAGYDGDYVDRSMLLIDPKYFTPVDLCGEFAAGRNFDLAISLEVAEHLPSPFSEALVRQLVAIAPMVLFSAAIPGQPGNYHVSEQWQDYWRSLFRSFSYHPVDLVRPMVWGNPNVEYWYQQNVILYCNEDTLRNRPQLRRVPDNVSLNLVHPDLYKLKLWQLDPSLKEALKMLPRLASLAVSRRWKNLCSPRQQAGNIDSTAEP